VGLAHAGSRRRESARRGSWVAALATVLALACSAPALADGPAWRIDSLSNTTAAPGTTFDDFVQITNVGTADTDGSEIDVIATLPPGVSAVSAANGPVSNFTCTGPGGSALAGATVVTCSETDVVPAHSGVGFRYVDLTLALDPGASGSPTSSFQLTGGGADPASTVDPTTITPAAPSFGVDAFDGQVTSDPAGDPFTQAGGHPYAASTSIDFNTTTNPNPVVGPLWPVEPTRDVLVDLPPGFIGNPTVAAQCTAADLANTEIVEPKPLCPPASQVGTALVRLRNPLGSTVFGPLPVFNLVPPANLPAQFGFNIAGTVVTLNAQLRSASDYGLSVNVANVPEGLDIAGTSLTFWGVPADPSHDADRACAGQSNPWRGGPSCSSGAPLDAFLRNPTSCTAPGVGLPTTLHIDSWVHPGVFQNATFFSHLPPAYPAAPSDFGPQQGPTGCAGVPFEPALAATPASPAKAGQPDGFDFDLTLPQNSDASGIGEADLKKAVVTLPAGVRVSPSAADGLGGCTPGQIGLHTTDDPTCPDASKIGSLTITTPLLSQQLTGSIYLASPHDNPFDSLLAIYLVAKGPGLIVKLPGEVDADAITGQLKATFDNNPQLPFSKLHLEFVGGPRASLTLPNTCGTYTTHAVLTSWSGTTVSSDSSFALSADGNGAPCPPSGFAPGFLAGTQNPIGGATSPFSLRLTRSDQDQELSSLAVDMPTGLLGKIANAVLCPDGAANAGTCEDVSKIGSVTVGAGAGPSPFYITSGRAYITGPYKGAPYGLSIVVPAVAGPFDLGNVVVRAAVQVDRHTAQLHVVSDPLPTILQGIPLDVRDVRVAVDKPDFIVNPTSCVAKHVAATVGSTLGAIAHVSTRFQVTDCGDLPLAPRMRLTVGGAGHTRTGVSTPLTATLTQTPGQTNLRSVSVSLPTALNALLPVVNQACTLAAFNAEHCGDRAKVGSAVAITPLLRDPLRGSAYFVKNPARPIPDLMVALRGPVSLDLTGKVTIPGGKHLATRFDTIPDAPITRFTLRLVSGRNGPLGVQTNLCSARARGATAALGFRGQNGALVRVNQRLTILGCPKAARARRARRR
jgi:hypothetical protein